MEESSLVVGVYLKSPENVTRKAFPHIHSAYKKESLEEMGLGRCL